MKRALVLVLLAGIATLLPQASASANAGPERQAAPQLTANCQHALGAGAVRSAGAVTLYSDRDVRVGAVQLCKDSSSRFWGYLTLDQPLAAGRWANAYIQAYWNGEYRATYSCAGTGGGGNGHIKQNERSCWTGKILGTDPRWTYYVYAYTCFGVFDDTSRCYADGKTKFTYR